MRALTLPDYHDRISISPGVLGGKPVVKGTRIPVDLVLQHLAEDPNLDDLYGAFPRLTQDDVRACLAYASALVGGAEALPAFRLIGADDDLDP